MTKPPDEKDAASLQAYLNSFAPAQRADDMRAQMIEGGVPLWRQILEYVPNPAQRGRALELGSPPFNISLLMQKFRNYDLLYSGSAADGRTEIISEMESAAYDERHEFRFTCFDVEGDRFPYDDNSFDLVIFCEVIEHLRENPLHTLSEIHRILRPGGAMILTTPNVSRFDNLVNLGRGRNIYDPYHLGSPFSGSRHLREYTFAELHDLVTGCGFQIERMQDHDIYPRRGVLHTALNAGMNRVVARLTGGHYRFHLFVRARKTQEPFRWRYPEQIFAPDHIALYSRPRDAYAIVGENDALHFAMGWNTNEAGPEGRPSRRAIGVGDIYLLCPDRVSQVTVTLAGGHGEIQTAHDRAASGEFVLVGVTSFDAPEGGWTDVRVPVNDDFEPGNPLHVRITAPDGVRVHSVHAGD